MDSPQNLYEKSDYKSAANLFREEIKADSENASAHEWLARCLYKLGDFESALEESVLAIKLKPDSVFAYLVQSTILTDKGDFLQAEQMARKAIETEPTMWEVFNNLARIMDAVGKPDESLLSLNQAVSLAPDDWRPHFSISILLNKLKQYSESVKEARLAFRIRPSGQTGYWLLRTIISSRRWLFAVVFATSTLIAPALTRATSFWMKLLIVMTLLLLEAGELFYGNKNRGRRGIIIVLIIGPCYLSFSYY